MSRPKVFGNTAFTDGIEITQAAIRLQGTEDADVYDNTSIGFHYGMRVTGNSTGTDIHHNSFKKCVLGIATTEIGGGVPTDTTIRENKIESSSSAVRLNVGDGTKIYENEWDLTGTTYAVVSENVGSDATNTIIGKNYRGFSAVLPTGYRAIPGETWRNNSYEAGSPEEWVAVSHTSSTSSTTVYGIGQRGRRGINKSPVGDLTPIFVGERVYDSANERWWTSFGTRDSDWA